MVVFLLGVQGGCPVFFCISLELQREKNYHNYDSTGYSVRRAVKKECALEVQEGNFFIVWVSRRKNHQKMAMVLHHTN